VKVAICVLLMCISAFAVGCGSDGESDEGTPTVPSTSATTTGDTAAEAPTLVGRWERVNECPQLVEAIEQAGLAEIAPGVVGDYFPNATPKELAQKDDLCKGAKPFVHSHFFNENHGFGSLTEDLEQVDDGIYEITDDGTFRHRQLPLQDRRRQPDAHTCAHQGDEGRGSSPPARVHERRMGARRELSGSRLEARRLQRVVLMRDELGS
jgi:hypothetical protein